MSSTRTAVIGEEVLGAVRTEPALQVDHEVDGRLVVDAEGAVGVERDDDRLATARSLSMVAARALLRPAESSASTGRR